jgi:excinuclease UvrABC ATPase subunit
VREDLARFPEHPPCDACDGKRLKPEALAVKIAALTSPSPGRNPSGEACAGSKRADTLSAKQIRTRSPDAS